MLLLAGVIISGVFAGTVTITDKGITTSDSNLRLNFTDGWIHSVNMTVDGTVNANAFVGDGSGLTGVPGGGTGLSVTNITNSNGKEWLPTGANLQAAIYDIGNNTGWVSVPATVILVTSTIIGAQKCNIYFNGATLYATTDIDVLRVRPQQIISDVSINVSQVASFTKACIILNGSDDFSSRANGTVLRNINLYGGSTQDGTGLYLYVSTDPTDPQLGFCVFDTLYISSFYRGIYLRNTATTASGGGWINSNLFSNIRGRACNYFIFLDNKEGEGATSVISATSGNIFENIHYQPSSGTDTYCISVEGNRNCFWGVNCWDWSSFGDSTEMFRLNFTANDTMIYSPLNAGGTNLDNKVVDSSVYSIFFTGNYLKSRGSNAPGLNITNINRYESSTAGVAFYKSTKTNPYTYLYGYVTSSAKYATFRVDTKGSLEIATQQSGIDLEPYTGVVNITSIIKLAGLTTHPVPAYEGMVYYNTTTDLLMLYTTAWHSIDMT